MSFISYAQNSEDIMLWRALQGVEKGFYIDVGANDPDTMSVTRAFYDAQWRGVNIEPVKAFFERLQHRRPRDINLCVGAGATDGEVELFNIPDSGLATSDPDIAAQHRAQGWQVTPEIIQVRTLAGICETHVQGEIHFLKIDVEGKERDVLLGMDFQRWRPWIVVVEATVPLSQKQVHQAWESLLTQSNYEDVYFDGLNRFYLAAEHAELKSAFAAPPNPFDLYITSDTHFARLELQESHARLNEQNDQIADLLAKLEDSMQALKKQQQLTALRDDSIAKINADRDAKLQMITELSADLEEKSQAIIELDRTAGLALAHANSRINALEQQIVDLRTSRSWRLTRPLRYLARLMASGSLGRAPRAATTEDPPTLKQALKRIARRSAAITLALAPVQSLIARPAVRNTITRGLRRFPRIDAKLRRLVREQSTTTSPAPQAFTSPITNDINSSITDQPTPLMSRAARQTQFSLARTIRK